MRWFTCTPVAFGGGPDFFARDSGLLCRGFQALGVESRAIMPGTVQADDQPDLIRTEFTNLESSNWWKGHRLDGVVLYAWGSPRFRHIARAIKDAGIFLVLNQDNGGLISPLAGFKGWLQEQWILSGGGLPFIKLVAKGLIGTVVTDPRRASHLLKGDVIACVSPAAVEHYRKLCLIYGGQALVNRISLLPHAVESSFKFPDSSARKLRKISCVGRWADTIQKRPHLMEQVLGSLTESDPEVTVEIAGKITPALQQWHAALSQEQQHRIRLRGIVSRNELARMLAESRIFYSSSAFESFGIAAGEALCSGCSIVSGTSISMASFGWFVSEQSGTLAKSDDAAGHVDALRRELNLWDQEARSPEAISEIWSERLHENRVASRAMEFKHHSL